jgi:hypothetical protein
MLFYRKILYFRVYSLIEIDGVQINLGFTQFQFEDWSVIPKKQNCPETELSQVIELPELSDPPGVRIPQLSRVGQKRWRKNELVTGMIELVTCSES